MDHFIDRIKIQNFKSIRELEVDGLKRINLFIGRPNVGKSNILEALALFSLPYVAELSKLLSDVIRIENYREMFHDGNIFKASAVGFIRRDANDEICQIDFNQSTGNISVRLSENIDRGNYSHNKTKYWFGVDDKFRVKYANSDRLDVRKSLIKMYSYSNKNVKFKETKYTFLKPPFGSNLLHVLELKPELRKLYAQWFRQYGLRLVLDTASQSLKVQKEKGDDEVFQLPYSSVADTLQRIIFYKTAVASNENSVLLFEEPEAHAFPPYIVEFTQEVIQSLTNQFFIVTHSPLIVEEFLTNAIDDLGIFNVDFKDGQTVVRPLTTEEIYDVRKYGVDLFFNNEAYLA